SAAGATVRSSFSWSLLPRECKLADGMFRFRAVLRAYFLVRHVDTPHDERGTADPRRYLFALMPCRHPVGVALRGRQCQLACMGILWRLSASPGRVGRPPRCLEAHLHERVVARVIGEISRTRTRSPLPWP